VSERQVEVQLVMPLPHRICHRPPSACPRARRSTPWVHWRRSLKSFGAMSTRDQDLPPASPNPNLPYATQSSRLLRKLWLLRVQLKWAETNLRPPRSLLPNNTDRRLRAPQRARLSSLGPIRLTCPLLRVVSRSASSMASIGTMRLT